MGEKTFTIDSQTTQVQGKICDSVMQQFVGCNNAMALKKVSASWNNKTCLAKLQATTQLNHIL